MIRIEKIHIKEFRGIRELTLDLKGQNFAACGPNGTGKSGIVDAIEFAPDRRYLPVSWRRNRWAVRQIPRSSRR